MATRHDTWHGSHWIRDERRLAILVRDRGICLWCNRRPQKLTLDHLIPHCEGGSNKHTNLVTACLFCNSARGSKSVEVFASSHGDKAQAILARIRTTIARPIDVQSAKLAITRAGGFVAACQDALA